MQGEGGCECSESVEGGCPEKGKGSQGRRGRQREQLGSGRWAETRGLRPLPHPRELSWKSWGRVEEELGEKGILRLEGSKRWARQRGLRPLSLREEFELEG